MWYNTTKNLPANEFTKTGYHFTGWSTTPAGAKKYTNQQSVSKLTEEIGVTITLYAKWEPNTYYIAYEANGGEGTMSIQTTIYNSTCTLANCYFARAGYIFAGWSDTADGEVNTPIKRQSPT